MGMPTQAIDLLRLLSIWIVCLPQQTPITIRNHMLHWIPNLKRKYKLIVAAIANSIGIQPESMT